MGKVNFSKLTDSNQIFRNDFVWIVTFVKFKLKLLSVIFGRHKVTIFYNNILQCTKIVAQGLIPYNVHSNMLVDQCHLNMQFLLLWYFENKKYM